MDDLQKDFLLIQNEQLLGLVKKLSKRLYNQRQAYRDLQKSYNNREYRIQIEQQNASKAYADRITLERSYNDYRHKREEDLKFCKAEIEYFKKEIKERNSFYNFVYCLLFSQIIVLLAALFYVQQQ